MKFGHIPAVTLAIFLAASLDASAGRRYWRPRHVPPAQPATPAPAAPPAPVQDTGQRIFKDVPVNAVFCFPGDRVHEWFPLVKISDNQAKSLVTPANPVSAVQVVSQVMVVFLSKKQAPAPKDLARN